MYAAKVKELEEYLLDKNDKINNILSTD